MTDMCKTTYKKTEKNTTELGIFNVVGRNGSSKLIRGPFLLGPWVNTPVGPAVNAVVLISNMV